MAPSGGRQRPVYATADDLVAAERRLQAGIEGVRAAMTNAIQLSEQRLQGAIAAAAAKDDDNHQRAMQTAERVRDDSKAFTENKVLDLEKRLPVQYLGPLEAKIQETHNSLAGRIAEVDDALRRETGARMKELAATFDAELDQKSGELQAAIDTAVKDSNEALQEQRKQIDQAISEARKKAKARSEEVARVAAEELQKARQDQAKLDEVQDERNAREQNELHLALERLTEVVQENRNHSTDETTRVENQANLDISTLRVDAEARFDLLDEESMKLRNAVQEVEQLPTRRVDWVIRNVSQRLRPPDASRQTLHQSWFSPKFNMAGVHGLQLELQIFKRADTPVSGEEAGDCAIFLWACKGANLVYKLHCGKVCASLEKLFNGRVPYGTKRLCWVNDQINKADNTLTISCEILESLRTVEHPVIVPEEVTDETVDETGEVNEGDVRKASRPKRDNDEGPLEGCLVYNRQWNNRMLEQVQSKVDHMCARMVRKVDWRIEHASRLRRCFPHGEAMCSTSFSAAGIEGMQLIFYPSGYTGAQDGVCSLFLYCPAGTTLRCTLHLGSQKRDASHTWEESGAFGRTNYCRFENVVEEVEDTVHVALEIDEAHQDVRAKVAHKIVVPGDRRTQGQIDGTSGDSIESVVKLSRHPGSRIQGLEDTRVLPSLWIAKSAGEMNVSMADGMHSMEDLKAPARRNAPGGGRRAAGDQGSLASPAPAAAGRMGARSESLPSLPKDAERTAYADANVTRFPRGFEQAEWGNAFGSKKGPAATGAGNRRNKGMASTHMGVSQPSH